MKLYLSHQSSSRSVQVVANEIGLLLELVAVDLKAQKFGDSENYAKVNPNAYLPALQLDDDHVILETAVILQYLADRAPSSNLTPVPGTMDRVRNEELLGLIATELHQKYFVVFREYVGDEARQQFLKLLHRAFGSLESRLADGRSYLLGETFMTADAYLWVMLTWTDFVPLDVTAFMHLRAYRQRIEARPSVKKAIQDELTVVGAP